MEMCSQFHSPAVLPLENSSPVHTEQGWVGPTAGVDVVWKGRKLFHLPRMES
jgi:hypothetical protein